MDESVVRNFEQQQLSTADILRRAKAAIGTPDRWCKDTLRDDAGRMCVLGAIKLVASGDVTACSLANIPPWEALMEAIPGGDPITFNNAPERTHDEVMAAFDRAIEIAETQR